jgi:hypothetical protein
MLGIDTYRQHTKLPASKQSSLIKFARRCWQTGLSRRRTAYEIAAASSANVLTVKTNFSRWSGAARGRDRRGTGLDLRNREAQGSEAAGDRDRVA